MHTATPILESQSAYGKKDVLVISKGISQEESQRQSCESIMIQIMLPLNLFIDSQSCESIIQN